MSGTSNPRSSAVARTMTTEFNGLVAVVEIQERHLDSDSFVIACEIEGRNGSPPTQILLVASLTSNSARTLCCAQPGDVLSVEGMAEVMLSTPWCPSPLLVIRNPDRVVGWRRFAF